MASKIVKFHYAVAGDVMDKRSIKKSTVKILAIFIILGVLGFITPYLLMIVGIWFMLTGAFSLSPTINLLRFYSRRAFSSAEIDLTGVDPSLDKPVNISWNESLILTGVGFGIFFASILLLSFGWNGII